MLLFATPARLPVLAAMLVGVLALTGCGERQTAQPESASAGTGDQSYSVVTTVGMITDTVREIAGDRAEVVGLIGSGIDPHLYAPTRSDVQRILDADIVFYNGLMLEGRMIDAFERAKASGRAVHAVTEFIDEADLLQSPDYAGQHDPHVWMDPHAWRKAVELIRDSLADHDPEHAAEYRANAAAYLTKLEALDAYAKRVLESVPEEQRVLVTAHDAFSYFGRRYGYEVMGIQGISTESEAGVRDIERLVGVLVDRRIGAVFIESTVSERNIKALVAGARAQGHTVTIGGSLFSDAMGPAGTYEGTYIGMIDHNATTIARALGGETPERGMSGALSE